MNELLEQDQENEELTEREYLQDLYNETMDNFDRMEEAGLYDPEDIDEMRANTLEEYQDRLAEAEGFDSEEDDDDDEEYDEEELEYMQNLAMANFSVGTDFGQILIDLIDEEYAGNEEEGVATVCEICGLEPEDLAALVQGEYAPTPELIDYLSQCFETTQYDEAYEGLQVLGAMARGEDIYEGDDYEDAEGEISEEVEEASYRIGELENQIAEFQATESVKDAIAALELKAAELVDEGCMTPFEAETMFGNFELESNRTAAFSQLCSAKAVDAATELYAMQYHLDLCEKRGSIATFGAIAPTMTEEEYDTEVALTRQAALNNNSRIDQVLGSVLRK
jgi:hypothetical protein